MTGSDFIDKNECHINRNQLAQDLKELIKKSEEYTEKISSIKIEQLEKSLKESIKILQDSTIDQKTALKIVEEILDKTFDEKIDSELNERIEFLLNSLRNSKQINDINLPVTTTIKFFYTFIVPSVAVLLSAAVSYGVFTTRLSTIEQSNEHNRSAVEIRVSGLERRLIELEKKSHANDIKFIELNQKIKPIENIENEVNSLKIQSSSTSNNLSTLLRDLRKIFNWCDKNENCK